MVLRGKLLLPDFKVREVDEKDLPKLKESLAKVLVLLENYSCELAGKNEAIATNIFADLISIIYKLPMILSYTPHTGLSTPFEYFFSYVVIRHLGKEVKFSNIRELMESLEANRVEFKDLFMYVTTLKGLYEKLLYTPADTRPGYNFTSLVSHLQLTSILVWLFQPYSIDLNYLRIAALLHDLGKLFNPMSHVSESVEILDKVIGEAVCLKPILSRVKELIEKHHEDFLVIIKKADESAAATDRLSEIVTKVLESENVGINECYDVCYSLSAKTRECMECLEKLGKDNYERASKILYKSILESLYDDTSELEEKGIIHDWKSTPSKKVILTTRESHEKDKSLGYLVYIDFPGVQRFITSFPKLRDMSFASFLVDFITSVYPFIVLDQEYYKNSGNKSRIPAEALLSGYGGHSYIVVRGDHMKKEEIEKLLDNSSLEELDVWLDVRVVDLAYEREVEKGKKVYVVRSYKEIWDDIASMGYKRYLKYKGKIYSVGLHRVCESCGIRPAVDIKDNEYLCDLCLLVRELSRSRGFMAKLRSTYYVEGEEVKPSRDIEIAGIEREKSIEEYEIKLGEIAMEVIAGYKKIDDTKYVALVKADGNDAGSIFGYTATFSEYIDKSFRLDYGVKKVFYETLRELLNAEKEVNGGKKDLTSRVLVGVLYLGGDDIMLMLPSVIAVPFAVKMFKRIKSETGFTFKVGVISVKPDHPVQFAYKAVNKLMESSKLQGKSSLSCLVFSSTLASDGVIESDLKRYRREKESYLVVSNDIENVKRLLEIVGLHDFKELIKIYKDDNKEKIRDIIRPLEDLTNYADTHNFYDTLAYILRSKARSKGEEGKDREYKLISFLLSSSSEELRFPLYDYYFILKSIKVGVSEWRL